MGKRNGVDSTIEQYPTGVVRATRNSEYERRWLRRMVARTTNISNRKPSSISRSVKTTTKTKGLRRSTRKHRDGQRSGPAARDRAGRRVRPRRTSDGSLLYSYCSRPDRFVLSAGRDEHDG